ncbi:hypothetical protein [Methanosarcina horonobensis]|uniref:hypothetical protein n=1 Tax=Methanosarcina horonobensis TaxID=418008 RepID=UPI001300D301|nr:hypothetical protein [Methanosarcina horonobensis]
MRILQERNEDTSGILSLSNEDEILDASLDRLKEIVKKENKIYLIFVENLHEVFRQLEPKVTKNFWRTSRNMNPEQKG